MAAKPVHHRPFELWVGRSGTGKTRACLEAIASRLRRGPRGAPLLMIVPEQASAQAEYDLAARSGLPGFTRARVFSFNHLRTEIFARAGGRPSNVIDDDSRVLILRQVIRRLVSSPGGLRILGRSADLPGLAESVCATLLELRRYGMTSAQLEALAQSEEQIGGGAPSATVKNAVAGSDTFTTKIGDLASIWKAYEQTLADRDLSDAGVMAAAAAEQLRTSNLFADAEIWIDGFHTFTTEELELLEALLAGASSAALTLCLDPRDPAFRSSAPPKGVTRRSDLAPRVGPERVFANMERTYYTLRERIGALGWHVSTVEFPRDPERTRFSSSGALAHLEARVLTRLRPDVYKGEEWNGSEGSTGSRVLEAPIEMVEAATPRDEIEFAARRIIGLCAPPRAEPGASEAGGASADPTRALAWSSVAVIARDLDTYAPLVREIFPRYGIPFFVDARRSISGHPVARLLLAALSLAEGDWRIENVTGYLKTGLTPLDDREIIARIEVHARTRRLSGRAEWCEIDAWHSPDVRHRASKDADAELRRGEIEGLHAELRRALAPALELGRSLLAGAECAEAIWRFLDVLGVSAKLEDWAARAEAEGDPESAAIHAQAWGQVVDLLDRLHTIGLTPAGEADAQTGDSADEKSRGSAAQTSSASSAAMSAPAGRLVELRETIETALATVQAGLIPPRLEEVVVASADRSRTPTVEVAIVVGLADGNFPRAFDEDPMLTDSDRTRLGDRGCELGPDSIRRYNQERFFAYMALTRASGCLIVSRPLADSEGRALGPSSFYRAVAEGFPLVEPFCYRDAACDVNTEIDASSEGAVASPPLPRLPIALGRWAVQVYHNACRGENPGAVARLLAEGHPLARAGLGADANAEAGHVIEHVTEALQWPRGAGLDPGRARSFWMERPVMSVTALEDYGRCPFKFFAGRTLRLQRPREPVPGPAELGQLRHFILERLFEELRNADGLDWGGIDLDRARSIVKEAAEEAATIALADDFGRDALTDTIIRAVTNEMGFFVLALKTMGERYGFVQVESEFQFGSGGRVAFDLPCDDELAFVLRGTIDRVDRLASQGEGEPNRYVVFDYKSSRRGIDPTKLVHGIDLQLPAYGLALESNIGKLKSESGPVAAGSEAARVQGLFYWPLTIGLAEATGPEWAEPATAKWFSTFHPTGLFEDEIADDLDTGVGPGEGALAFAFKRKKDGVLAAVPNGHVPSEVLRAYFEFARELMCARAQSIARGEIKLHPWRDGRGSACGMCDYSTVCRIKTCSPEPYHREDNVSFKQFGAQMTARAEAAHE